MRREGRPYCPLPGESEVQRSAFGRVSVLTLLLQGLSQDSAKRLRFVPGVIYVDGMSGP